jgi:hypothetical protein
MQRFVRLNWFGSTKLLKLISAQLFLPLQLQQTRQEDVLEAEFGFPLFTSGDDKLGWLMNMQPVS